MENVLIIVPHPDDVAFGMGGTALQLKDRYHLHVLCATKGERGVRGQDMAVTAAIREKEEAAACTMLGADLTFLGLIDGDVYADRVVCEQVAEEVRKIQPVAIFTIWPIDSHPDHSAISEITRKACRLAAFTGELYYMEEGMGDQTTCFHPDIYMETTHVYDERLGLLRLHACQNVGDGLVKAAITREQYRGNECGCQYAEGFKMPFPPRIGHTEILSNI
ncbi:MAG TPA: PIG-L deacetylase family protein [Armatimonadota bacterium]|nr:PIG-L deacetylase family protein [Armatimonadota bacterium]